MALTKDFEDTSVTDVIGHQAQVMMLGLAPTNSSLSS